MDDRMKDFVGYRKNRPSSVQKGFTIPEWANSTEMAILTFNLSIILIGLVISGTISDVTTGEGNSTLLSFFGRC